MGKWSDLLFSGQAEATEVQAPIQRPAPIERPGFDERPAAPRPMQRAQPQQPEQMPEPQKPAWSKRLFEGVEAAPQPAPRVAEAPKAATFKDPKNEGWLEWMDNNITGRKDPRYANAPAISRVLENEIYDDNSDAARASYRQITAGQALTPDDRAHADIVRNALGKRFIGMDKDQYGADVVRYRDKNGQEAVAYVNKPGLDLEDINNVGLQSLPYIIGGRVMGGLSKSLSLPFKAMGQAGGAFATSVGGDLAARRAGSEQAPDIGRATAAAAVGGVAETLSPGLGLLWRKLVTEPGLVNKGTGQLTPKGAKIAQDAGFDPADMTADVAKEFAQKYAAIRDPVIAGQSVRGKEFDLPVTRGQLTKDPGRLLNEKAMRYGAFGETAKDTIQAFDQRQAAAISEAALGGGEKSIARAINPGRVATGTRPGDVGEGIRSGVRSARDAAKVDENLVWKQVGTLEATPEALELLPKSIATSLDDLAGSLTKDTAPKASAMLDTLRNYKKGGAPAEADEFLGNVKTPSVDTMRRNLFQMMKGAQSGDFDGVAAGRVYEGFNKWIDDAAEAALLKGDANAAATLRVARDRTREMKQIFGPTDKTGQRSAGGALIDKIVKKDDLAPESIVRELFGTNPGSGPKQATLEAVRRIKQGAFKYLPKDQAAPIWNDIRLAHWMNLVKTSSGELHTPTMITKRIDEAFSQQGSVLKELYTPAELATIRRFGAAMKDLAYKDPNPSSSAVGNLFYGGQWGQALLSALGSFNGPIAKITQTIMRSTPVGNATGYVAAQSAISPTLRPRNPSLGALGASGAAQYDR